MHDAKTQYWIVNLNYFFFVTEYVTFQKRRLYKKTHCQFITSIEIVVVLQSVTEFNFYCLCL